MATSATLPVLPVEPSPEYKANKEALLKHSALKGYQVASAVAPPLFVVATLVRKKPLSVNSILRATWIAGAGGAVAGFGASVFRLEGVEEAKLTAERVKLAYDANTIQRNDHALIGSLIFGALTPAVFYKRTRLAHSILGGAGVGAALGVASHYYKTYKDGETAKKRLYERTVGR